MPRGAEHPSLQPLEVVPSGTKFEVKFGNAQIHFGVTYEGESPFGLHAMNALRVFAHVAEKELLLIDGGRSKQGRAGAGMKPAGDRLQRAVPSRIVQIAHLSSSLAPHISARIIAVPESYQAAKFLIATLLVSLLDVVVRESHPTRAQPKRLGWAERAVRHSSLRAQRDTLALRSRPARSAYPPSQNSC